MASQRITLGGAFYVPAVLAVITVIYLGAAFQLGAPMKAGHMTPAFFPIMTAILMLIALAVAMLQAVKQARAIAVARQETDFEQDGLEQDGLEQDSRRGLGISFGALGVVGLTAGYLVAFDRLGYLVATFVYISLLICLFAGNITQRLMMKLLAAAVITGAGYLLFEVLFQVRLPSPWSL